MKFIMADDKLLITELVLTAYLYNQSDKLGVDDLPQKIRKHYWNEKEKTVKRPIYVTEGDIRAIYGLENVKNSTKMLPFLEFEEFGSQIKLTVFELCTKWFAKHAEAIESIDKNPILASFFESYDSLPVSYERAKASNVPKESGREWINSLIKAIESEKGSEDMLRLVNIVAPEDIKQDLKDLVLTKEQEDEIEKMAKAIQYRDYLRRIGLTEIGKLLFVGPPGTGKTSLARSLSGKLRIPIVEVKLSQIADQYLGETAKNIDRVFELAKRLSPCILFIDEFDFVAKARATDEHAALKRAVNTLLKAIDEISLVDYGVLLIGATNHPTILDHAAWRRFDEIVEFTLPDKDMRKKILDIVLREIEGTFDTEEIAKRTEGYSGSDLRLIVREAVLNGLITERTVLTQQDLLRGVGEFNKRIPLRTMDEAR
ncbi:AAA+ family ATPase [Candidatus Methanoperedens nitroreducens]|uniref:AAA+ family ATPase n=2 Tax=Candidatus Methanoperedens nitratireducens TaxID=1392998 RepID=A0A062UWX2_9EURY|nr:AAA+ family ATPase [Candidatus Methanoperedens nitroreducens]